MTTLAQSLAVAGSLLIAAPTTSADLLGKKEDWQANAGLLFYTETNRVSALEPIISATRSLDTDEYLSFSLTVDTLTGASASGALPSSLTQTFTRPSGSGNYTTAQNTTPLDDTFRDTRATLSTSWTKPVRRNTTAEIGANLSKEYDYQSLGLSTRLSQDVNDKNTTLSLGLSLNFDTGSPVGGEPIPFSVMLPAGQTLSRQSDGSDKQVTDAVLGLTQIIDKNSLFQINYSLSSSDGYLTDPYKVVSVVDSTTGNVVFENASQPELPTVLFENRPNSRLKQSMYFQYKRALGSNVLDGSYRFLTDDWGVQSNTVDMRYRFALGNGKYLQPHLRWYQQNAADFYTAFFTTQTRPENGVTSDRGSQFASADYRLGDFTAWTLGLEYGRTRARGGWSLAAEYYLQSGDEPDGKFGALEQQTLYPDVDAFIVRFIKNF